MYPIALPMRAPMDYSSDVLTKQSRRELYALRSVSQANLPKGHRVTSCQKVPDFLVQKGLKERSISKNEHGKAFFSGMGSCGDVHSCPVCREKVGLTRANEIHQILSHNRTLGGIALLVTLTVRHTVDTPLKTLVDGLAIAKRKFSSSHAVKTIRSILQYKNIISGRDLTYGNVNGWHPHYHDIWLIGADPFQPDYISSLPEKSLKFLNKNKQLCNSDKSINLDELQKFLAKFWANCCVKSGLSEPSITRGLDIQYRNGDGGCAVGSYIAKWAFELSCSHKKQSKSTDSMTAFDILRVLKQSWSLKNSKLWAEYADAYFGKALIYFGRGLKIDAGITEIEDDQLAERPETTHFCEITSDHHKAIVYFNAFGEVLDIAQNYSSDVTKSYINHLVFKYYQNDRDRRTYLKNLRLSIDRDTMNHIAELGLFTNKKAA